MRSIDFQDDRGRWHRSMIPDDAPDEDAYMGNIVGPPDVVDSLDLPVHIATRLHNELFSRGIWGYDDVCKRPQALQGALRAALRLDTQTLANAIAEYDREDSIEF